MSIDIERIEHMLKYMEEDYLTENEKHWVAIFKDNFAEYGNLSVRQLEILTDIFNKASERDTPPTY